MLGSVTLLSTFLVIVATCLAITIVRLRHQHARTKQLVLSLQDEQTQLADANARLADLAIHDSLTELLNRAGIVAHLDAAIARSRDSHQIAVLFVDIDRFKSINDSLGHSAGDQLLQVMGRRIRSVLPSGCTAGRLGGDEFVIVIENVPSVERVSEIAHRLTRDLSEPLEVMGRMVRISASIGVAIGPDAQDTASELWASPISLCIVQKMRAAIALKSLHRRFVAKCNNVQWKNMHCAAPLMLEMSYHFFNPSLMPRQVTSSVLKFWHAG